MRGRFRRNGNATVIVLAAMWTAGRDPVVAEQTVSAPKPVAQGNPAPAPASSPLPPPNDECSGAIPIEGEGIFPFDATNATFRLFDLTVCSVPSDTWYCWTAPCSGDVTVDTCGQTVIDTAINVYAWCDCPARYDRWFRTACDYPGQPTLDPQLCGFQTAVTFPAIAGEQYLIELGTTGASGIRGGPGTFRITCADRRLAAPCSLPAANCQARDNRNAYPSDGLRYRAAENFRVTTATDVTQICWWGAYFNVATDRDCSVGAGDHFDVRYYDDAGGAPGNLIAGPFSEDAGTLVVYGPTRTYGMLMYDVFEYAYSATHPPIPAAADACYWVEITNDVSDACTWYWEAAKPVDGLAATDGDGSTGPDGYGREDLVAADLALCVNAPLTARPSCITGPPNDACAAALPVSDGLTPFDTRGATTDGPATAYGCANYSQDCCLMPLGDCQVYSDVWFDYVATCTGDVRVGVCESDFDPKVVIYETAGCPPHPGLGAFDDDACAAGAGFGPQAVLPVTAGTAYKIRVGGYGRQRSSDCFVYVSGSTRKGCDDSACQAAVCATHPTCCTYRWDSSCVTLAGQRCLGDAGRGTLEIECGARPAEDDCAQVPVTTLPAVLTGSASFSTEDCESIPGREAWAAFVLSDFSTVTIDFAGSTPTVAWPVSRLAGECPCADFTSEALLTGGPDGNPVLTWECLRPGNYFYALRDQGDGGEYRISISSGSCVSPCGTGGDCCSEQPGPGCLDRACCEAICHVDPFCCAVAWDGWCARQAESGCPACGSTICDLALGDCDVESAIGEAGCNDTDVCRAVCSCDPYCCAVEWDALCAGLGAVPGCGASAADCNANGRVDPADVVAGVSEDCNRNFVPDECEPDCNQNFVADECDVWSGASVDCNDNDIPDECENDCNNNGIADECDIATETSTDCNGDAVPDECGRTDDCDGNGVLDVCDIAAGDGADFNGNGVLDACDANLTWRVDDDAPNDPGPGDPAVSDPLEDGSPDHPFDAIAEAIANAISGDEILLLPGVYRGPGNRGVVFDGPGLLVRCDGLPGSCVIDAELASRVVFVNDPLDPLTFDGITFRNGKNTVYGDSAGVFASYAEAEFRNCRFLENRAAGLFGVVSNLSLHNCVFFDNTSSGLIVSSGRAFVDHCTFTRRATTSRAPAIELHASNAEVRNCILWGNGLLPTHAEVTAYLFYPLPVLTIAYCDVAGGPAAISAPPGSVVWGPGNIDADPLFLDAAGGDLHLAIGSPCVDRGDPSAPDDPTARDMDGEARLRFCRTDIGADEAAFFSDCDENHLPDACECLEGFAADCSGDLIPDVCDPDCDNSGTPDSCDVASGAAADCNGNAIPDGCDVAGGAAPDCNANGIPDECDMASGAEDDCNANGAADSCDVATQATPDCNANGVPDACDMVGAPRWLLSDSIPDRTADLTVWYYAPDVTSAEFHSPPYSVVVHRLRDAGAAVGDPGNLARIWLRYYWKATGVCQSCYLDVWVNMPSAFAGSLRRHEYGEGIDGWTAEVLELPAELRTAPRRLDVSFSVYDPTNRARWYIDDIELVALPIVDCNRSGELDACETGDFYSGGGPIGSPDFREFHECLTGICGQAVCDDPLYTNVCCGLADGDEDGDVDLRDMAVFQRVFGTTP
ncbi:MAG: hypothetical protein HY763_01280 [Planctomycetes bacterium]|nr:hypothetical protein [Planctomycetota bacterium]